VIGNGTGDLDNARGKRHGHQTAARKGTPEPDDMRTVLHAADHHLRRSESAGLALCVYMKRDAQQLPLRRKRVDMAESWKIVHGGA
jgi:hypothetical protein